MIILPKVTHAQRYANGIKT